MRRSGTPTAERGRPPHPARPPHRDGRRRRRGRPRGWLLLAAVLTLLLGVAAPAQAYPQAFNPTQDSGNRGSDVVALQYLLNAHGASLSADGVFGSGTDAAVKSFQRSKGLADDGIVGPNTWSALQVTVRQGDRGPAVKAVQYLLNAKRGSGLAVDGIFGGGTAGAVRTFQSHAGIGADSIVGPTTWRNLLWHYEAADFGGPLCDQDPDGNGNANWGTAAAIGQVEAAASAFGGGNGQVPLGDAGFEHGGDIPGHASHEQGMDVDLWPIRTDSAQCSADRITWRSAAYDRAATRKLAQAIRNTAPGHVKLIFFNDPQLIAEGLTTEYPNHDNHLHVRYCERVHPSSLYDC